MAIELHEFEVQGSGMTVTAAQKSAYCNGSTASAETLE